VGCPIRKSSDQSLLTTPRGLSQRATSFIACIRQGIHQTPFSQSLETSSSRPRPRTRILRLFRRYSRPASRLTQKSALPLHLRKYSRLIPLSRFQLLNSKDRIQKTKAASTASDL